MRLIGLMTLLGFAPGLAFAQEPSAVHAVSAIKVLSQPEPSATILADAHIGEILEVLDSRDGWYLVKPPLGSDRTWRTGWVERSAVRGLPADLMRTTPTGAARQEGTPADQTATAKPAPSSADERAIRRKALTMGLIGVGTAVTGIIVHQKGDDGLNLPGSSTTQETVGFALIGVGTYWAVMGLWRALR
jgi:hypothetical protein